MDDQTRASLTGLVSRIEAKLADLKTLDIRTVVGTFQPKDGKPDGELELTGTAHVLHTSIDLIEGDARTSVDDWFLDPARKPILDLHLAREKQGADTIKANLEALQHLWKWASDVVKK